MTFYAEPTRVLYRNLEGAMENALLPRNNQPSMGERPPPDYLILRLSNRRYSFKSLN